MHDTHKMFLQACLSHGSLEKSFALDIFQQILNHNNTDDDSSDTSIENLLKDVIVKINDKISFVDQRIIEMYHEVASQNYFVIISTVEDPINRSQMKFTLLDRNYFSLLLKEIVLSDSKSIEIIQGINLIAKLKEKKLTKQYAGDLIKNWINIGYILENDDQLYLGPRSISELGFYLKTHYPDYVCDCSICLSVIFYGVKCGNDECNLVFHSSCIKERLRKFNDCPNCKEKWTTLY